MTVFILSETSSGYALFKSKDKKLFKDGNLQQKTSSVEDLCNLLKLKKFAKFEDSATALDESAALADGKVTPLLKQLLDSVKDEKKASLAVADPKLGNAIHKLPQFDITPVSDSSTADIHRAVRQHFFSLVPDLKPQGLSTTTLGLSHSLSRHKLKFSPDKVDTMIVQAISLLDDLDKEVNTYAMRLKEWYGWHFPEMAKIINDNMAYARVVLKMGQRSNASTTDFAEILPEEIEDAIKHAAELSMGTDIAQEDLDVVTFLSNTVIELYEYRQQLVAYLSARMQAIAPNLTELVGELVGARLIAHAGSLINLAKSPASTIQILGAEKALFRALKTKHDTPKYGLIFHASLVGQASGKNKAKIARLLAAKTALGLRIDSLSDWGASGEGDQAQPDDEEKTRNARENKKKIESRLRSLEGKPLVSRGVNIGPQGQTHTGKFEIREARKYNPAADGISPDAPAAAGKLEALDKESRPKLIEEVAAEANGDSASDENMGDASPVANGGSPKRKRVNGNDNNDSEGETKADKKARKEKKKKTKEEKEARKAEKRAKKEAKADGDSDGKKRKREGEGEKSEKKKKKKEKH